MTNVEKGFNTPNATVVTAALSRALASPVFVQAQRQRRLLRYIVEESAAGRGGRLNQFSIGIDALGRGADFDPTTDSGVRVEVGRLRSKLREYYEAYPDESVIFRLPKGRYVADIEVTDEVSINVPNQNPAPTGSKPCLVVLPFENVGGDRSDEYFADGITDDLITDMSKLSGLKVIARNSAFTYKGHHPTAEQLAQELGVTHVLEGSVRCAGKRLRINAQLIECATGDHLWADRMDRELTDIFAVQDEVGRRIVTALSIALTATDRFRFFDRSTENLEAYDYVLRAARLSWTQGEIKEAYELLQNAVALDPAYGLAHARIAANRWYAVLCAWVDQSAIQQALDSAQKAEQLDSDNSDVQAIYGFVNYWYGSTLVADTAGDKSITLDPTNVRALERRAITLAYLGRCDEAETYLNQAKVLNPHEPYYYPRGLVAYMRGNNADAIDLLNASAERFPSFMPTRVFLASIYLQSDDLSRSLEHINEIRKISPQFDLEHMQNNWRNLESQAGERFVNGLRDAWCLEG